MELNPPISVNEKVLMSISPNKKLNFLDSLFPLRESKTFNLLFINHEDIIFPALKG
jgi:hypothetical protein